jgi:putative ABC transport system permease protein
MGLRLEDENRQGGLGQDALFRLVSAGYLQTIGARLRSGRLLDDRDSADALPVVVVNAALADQYWPGADAIGHRVDTGTGDGAPRWMTIVGVVEEIKERGLDFGAKPAVYVPFTQTPIAFFQPSQIAVRTSVAPMSLAADLQRAVWAVDPQQPVSTIRTLDDIVDVELGDRRQMLALLGAFAAVALTLAVVGIYAVVSGLVAESRREIGVRMAVGAGPAAIVLGVLRTAAALTLAGVGVGLAGAAASTRLLKSALFGVSPLDPTVLALVSVGVAIVSLAAACVPAMRAAGVDVVLALRSD